MSDLLLEVGDSPQDPPPIYDKLFDDDVAGEWNEYLKLKDQGVL